MRGLRYRSSHSEALTLVQMASISEHGWHGLLLLAVTVVVFLARRLSLNALATIRTRLLTARPLLPGRRSESVDGIAFSERDRFGAFEHRKVVPIAQQRKLKRRRFLLMIGGSCLVAFAIGFVWPEIVALAGAIHLRSTGVQHASSSPGVFMPFCVGRIRFRTDASCLVDGDTGWERGVKWRLANVDTPELMSPRCVREFRLALDARNLLQSLMSQGYRVNHTGRSDTYGRILVRIVLPDGRDVGDALVAAGLARSWPYGLKRWCDR